MFLCADAQPFGNDFRHLDSRRPRPVSTTKQTSLNKKESGTSAPRSSLSSRVTQGYVPHSPRQRHDAPPSPETAKSAELGSHRRETTTNRSQFPAWRAGPPAAHQTWEASFATRYSLALRDPVTCNSQCLKLLSRETFGEASHSHCAAQWLSCHLVKRQASIQRSETPVQPTPKHPMSMEGEPARA